MHPLNTPVDVWPLDRLLVGVGTLRTTRELMRRSRGEHAGPLRAWDLALRSQVTVQGSSNAVDRLEAIGLISIVRCAGPGRAKEFSLVHPHPLTAPLAHLFHAERLLIRQANRP